MRDLGQGTETSASTRNRSAHIALILSGILVASALPGFSGRAGAFGYQPRQGRPTAPGFQQGFPQNPWSFVTTRQGAATANAAARLAQSGVTCEPGVPEDRIEACVGKNAGDACTFELGVPPSAAPAG
jgi:hypothetical protein